MTHDNVEFVCEFAKGKKMCGEIKKLLTVPLEELVRLYKNRMQEINDVHLLKILSTTTKRFKFGGADFLRTNKTPNFILLEINSAPGFAYCTPGKDSWEWSYKRLANFIKNNLSAEEINGFAFLTQNKIACETDGFSNAFKDVFGMSTPVFSDIEISNHGYVRDGYLYIEEKKITSALRYLHDTPWILLPPDLCGKFFNSTDVDLAGARNKVAAYLAFERFNKTHKQNSINLFFPRTWIVSKDIFYNDIPSDVIIKLPYLNSGQGVFFGLQYLDSAIKTNNSEVVVQELIRPVELTNADGCSTKQVLVDGFIHDYRMVVGNGEEGFFPMAFYARRAKKSYFDNLSMDSTSSTMLTNIAVKDKITGAFHLEYDRLVLPTDEGWSRLNITPDDFSVLFVQTALSMLAVDDYAITLYPRDMR